jgi:hypothetical protein
VVANPHTGIVARATHLFAATTVEQPRPGTGAELIETESPWGTTLGQRLIPLEHAKKSRVVV